MFFSSFKESTIRSFQGPLHMVGQQLKQISGSDWSEWYSITVTNLQFPDKKLGSFEA